MWTTLALTLACGAPQLGAQRPPDSGRVARVGPDVVVFVIDDVADSDIDVIPTPNLDAIAAAGVRFRRAYAHAWCAPTRDSLAHSCWLGIDRGDACGPAGPETRDAGDFSLVKMFEGCGYNTCHFGKWHLGSNRLGPWELTPQLNGFDHALAEYPVGNCELPGPGGTRVDDGVVSQDVTNDTIALRDAFLEWWQATPSPRFAMVNFTAAHSPFRFPPPSILPPGYPHPFQPTEREAFEAEVVGVDFVLGQLAPFFDPTDWVVFLGDNGTPEMAARPDQIPTHLKLTCYEDGIRVPLIVSGPGTAAGLESRALVHVIDLLPTFSSVLGLPAQPVDGVSFLPALSGGPGPRSFVFSYGAPRLDCALIEERWKLLRRVDGVEELYDLLTDPREQNPLPPTGPRAASMRTLRERILAGRSTLDW